MSKITVKRLTRHIEAGTAKAAAKVRDYKASSNPQIKEIYNQALGELNVLQALSDAIHRGDMVGLRLISDLGPER